MGIDWAYVLNGWFIELTIGVPAILLLAFVLVRGSICPHLWRSMKWGHDLDARRCRICRRFEVWALFDWSKRRQSDFPDAALAETPGEPLDE